MRSSLKIIDASTARLFMENSPKRRLLLSLVDRTRSVSEMARAEYLPIKIAHRIVIDFLRRGLVEVEREERRAGRAIKHYRAVARSFHIPLEFVSASPGAGLAVEMRSILDDALARSDDRAIIFYVDEAGEPRVSWFGDRDRRVAVAEFWQILKLGEADALDLIRAMEDLFKRFQARSGEGRTFVIHGAVGPRAPRPLPR